MFLLLLTYLVLLVGAQVSLPICSELSGESSEVADQVFLPDTSTYTSESRDYWSIDAWLNPDCIFVPDTAESLARGVKLLVDANSTFAIRGGGHAPLTGAANTNHGVLIALSKFRTLELVTTPNEFKRDYVKCGADLVWGEIYDYLAESNRGAVGGRIYTVGLGANLGGGMSFLSQKYGWSSSNIANFELVIASGEILQVNQMSHPDLFWALKGGGNNYGIITRFDLNTYQVTQGWGLNVGYTNDSMEQFYDAMSSWMAPGGGHDDIKGSLMPSTRYFTSNDSTDAGLIAWYSDAVEYPQAFENFTAIPSVSTGFTGLQSIAEIVGQTEQYYGPHVFKWQWWGAGIKFDDKSMRLVVNTMIETAKELLPHLNDGFVGCAEEPISEYYSEAAQAQGGDPMDLDPAKGGFLNVNFYVAWLESITSEEAENFCRVLIDRVEQRAKEQGVYYPFRWLNTAGLRQDVFSLYGEGNSLPRMLDVSRSYDPLGAFQKLVPGLKLEGYVSGA